MNVEQITDHESILLLRQDVKALKEGQDSFHREMKDSFKDLKDNYATRLDVVEKGQLDADRRFIAKEIQDKKNDLFNEEIESIKDEISDLKLIRKLLYGAVGTILILVLTAIIFLVVQK